MMKTPYESTNRLLQALEDHRYPSPLKAVPEVESRYKPLVEPLVFPEEFLYFHNTIDISALVCQPIIYFNAIEDCADGRLMCQNEDNPFYPKILFPVCEESHQHYLIELGVPGVDPGGRIFEWGYGAWEFIVNYSSFGGLLDRITDTLLAGGYDWHEGGLHTPHPDPFREAYRLWDDEIIPEYVNGRPLYVPGKVYPEHPPAARQHMPEHWKLAEELAGGHYFD